MHAKLQTAWYYYIKLNASIALRLIKMSLQIKSRICNGVCFLLLHHHSTVIKLMMSVYSGDYGWLLVATLAC